MKCLLCGKELPENAKFCDSCGARVSIGNQNSGASDLKVNTFNSVDGIDNSIEHHEIRNHLFFKCRLCDFCSFRIRIVLSFIIPNWKGENINCRIVRCIQHNHTKETQNSIKIQLEKSGFVEKRIKEGYWSPKTR